ncbi:MAG: phosphate signaling complex protein PhoU [Candidatus Omnitrophica bacterium]|nr:phosphate signaling complex protein PhoU [Candidatus Omnitrophota bacterium]
MLTRQVSELKTRLIEFATLVENMIDKSVKGLMEKNQELLLQVMKEDEPKANNYDREIDEMCTQFIAQFEPMAKDLRMVLMIMKMNKDLERMGDHAVNISESGLFLTARPPLQPMKEVPVMAKNASSMLKDSITSFIKEDAALAREVCERDNVVDDLGDKILAEVTAFLKEEHDGVKRSLHLMRISHNLERIADLSTNICEEVIYITEGKDIKHKKGDDISPSA